MYSVRFAGTRSRKRDDRRLAVSARRRFAVGVVAAAVGFGFVPAISPSTPTSVFACPSGYYENVDGQCIPAPRQVPPGSGRHPAPPQFVGRVVLVQHTPVRHVFAPRRCTELVGVMIGAVAGCGCLVAIAGPPRR